ncbi:MAG: hypothetical protein WD035_03250 [Balneolaceae bacterium]
MPSKSSQSRKHSQFIFETGVATVSSGGHWFNATRETVEKFVPGLLKRQDYEKLIKKAVAWIESADSLSMILYFVLVFTTNVWIASLAVIPFYLGWFYYKSAFINLPTTPILQFFNLDSIQLGVAAVALSFLGIEGMYSGLMIGILYFFLFKVGLLRMGLEKWNAKRSQENLTLNDRVFKMILVRYAIYENMNPPEVERLEEHIKETLLKHKT